jgi:hypothetical protein
MLPLDLILPPDSLIQQRPGARHRALRLDRVGVRALFVTGAWLARSFFRGAPPGWDFGPAVAAIRRRLTEWAAASPQASRSGGK